jgi:hypothetical protein
MKTRTDLLNFLAEKYNLQRYLEIGVQVPELNFDNIKCPYKAGVDPDPKAKATFCKTSDDFFDMILEYSYLDRIQIVQEASPYEVSITANGVAPSFSRINSLFVPTTYDLVFIDGLHTAEQVKKDFKNALKILSPNGFIVLHDCNPEKEEHTIVPRPTERGHWNGDVWRFAVAFTGYDNLWRWTVDIDNGCTVFWNRSEALNETVHYGISEMPWSHFDKNRKELLNLISWDEFIAIGS